MWRFYKISHRHIIHNVTKYSNRSIHLRSSVVKDSYIDMFILIKEKKSSSANNSLFFLFRADIGRQNLHSDWRRRQWSRDHSWIWTAEDVACDGRVTFDGTSCYFDHSLHNNCFNSDHNCTETYVASHHNNNLHWISHNNHHSSSDNASIDYSTNRLTSNTAHCEFLTENGAGLRRRRPPNRRCYSQIDCGYQIHL